MDVLLPRYEAHFDQFYYNHRPVEDAWTGKLSYLPVFYSDNADTLRVPGHMYQTYGRRYNDVVHAKLVGLHGLPLKVANAKTSDADLLSCGCHPYSYGDVICWQCYPDRTLDIHFGYRRHSLGPDSEYLLSWCSIGIQKLNGSAIDYCWDQTGGFDCDLDTWPATYSCKGTPPVKAAFQEVASFSKTNKFESFPSFDQRGEVAARLIPVLVNIIGNSVYDDTIWERSSGCRADKITCSYNKPECPTASVELLGETDHFIYGDHLRHDFVNYQRSWLTQHAYLDALDNIPRMNDNSLQNVSEVCKFVYNLVMKHQIVMPRSLQSGWLQYRYQLGTSSLDAKEAIDYIRRRSDILDLDYGMTIYGSAKRLISDCEVECRCEIQVEQYQMRLLKEIIGSLYAYGLKPDFYIVWDMIPYSFIVDWLIPIGDLLRVEDVSAQKWTEKLNITSVGMSLKYLRSIKGNTYSVYSRFLSRPPKLNGLYWLDKNASSTKTWFYRILDGASLLLDH